MTVPDPKGLPPLCGVEEFAELTAEMVTDHAPRVFAVVQEYGDRVDARVAAWGLAHADHVDIIGVDGTILLGAAAPEILARRFGRDHVSARVIWPELTPGVPDGA